MVKRELGGYWELLGGVQWSEWTGEGSFRGTSDGWLDDGEPADRFVLKRSLSFEPGGGFFATRLLAQDFVGMVNGVLPA